MYDGIPHQVKQRAGDRGITAEDIEKSQHTDFNEDTTNESASVACSNIGPYGCESWTLRKNEETRLDAFEMKGLRRMLRVSWTAKKTNEWVLNKAGVKRELLNTVKARSHNEETRELPGERDNARNNARCTQARKTTHGLDGQHQDVDRTLRGRVSQNDRGHYNNEIFTTTAAITDNTIRHSSYTHSSSVH